ncbi:beta-1,4-galactosyltransferase 2-like [Sycon ciliatum]|uniref:beta-1,4-galactosyltransferase 2-like n=1 Tax=Sycon ciliatum TaxID=27933 RepID=UPI0031F67801
MKRYSKCLLFSVLITASVLGIVTVEVLLFADLGNSSMICGNGCVGRHIRTLMKGATKIAAQAAASAGIDVKFPVKAGRVLVAPGLDVHPATSASAVAPSAPITTVTIRVATAPPSTRTTSRKATTTAAPKTVPPRLCADDSCAQNSCCCAVQKVPDVQLTPDLNTVPDENALITRLKVTGIKEGGWWQPHGCTVEHSLAIVIPFRNREAHLLIFLQHIHPYLQRQKLAHTIYVVDQVDKLPFNRAMLFNVGYREAMAERNYTCLSFHDVDNIPVDPMLSYRCGPQPQHMAARTDKWKWGLPYAAFTGGVSKQSPGQVEKMNGFANRFWGWGGEDDDILQRWKVAGYNFTRPPSPDGRFATVKRDHFQSSEPNPQSFKLLQTSGARMRSDGLNNLKYKLVGKKKHALYTRLRVELRR